MNENGRAGQAIAWVKGLDWRVPLALGCTYVFFGSGPAAAAAAIKSLPPFLMVGVRGLIAGAILTAWALMSGAPRPTRRHWAAGGLIGLLILTFGAGGGTYGQLTVPSGIAGVLSALLPLLAACIGYVLFREKLQARALIGLAIGFAGVALLLRPGSDLDGFGVAVIISGQVAWAFGAELAPRVGLPDDPGLAAGIELLGGGTVLVVAAALLGDIGRLDLASVAWTSWLGFGWFIVIGVAGFTAFGFLAKTVAPSISTTFSYVNPVVALTLGWLLFSESVSIRMVLATAVIIAGVCLIVSTKSETPSRTRHPFTSGHGYAAHRPAAARPARTPQAD